MIQKLSLVNFRKFQKLNLEFNNKIIIFSGPNAVGKTSILEAIYLLSTSKSHRTNDIETLIRQNEEYSVVEVKESKTYKMILSKSGKQSFINDVPYPKMGDFIGEISTVLFSPTDIDLIQGSKSVRRRFLDLELSLIDKRYLKSLYAYKKVLKERNELLKKYNEKENLMLEVLTNQIIELIENLYQVRVHFLEKINYYLKSVCEKLSCETIYLKYHPSYDIHHLKENFQSKLNYDLLTKTTNIGLHRDDFEILLDDTEAKEFASEGQLRNTVLAIKLAIKEIYQSKGKQPIFLLDDVFASLDKTRINHIMEYIQNEHQTFITTTSLFNIPDGLLKDAQIIRL
ncbi:MAG: DNA replication and repair protein RecF [Anaeroplasmataceae bacterium]|nr:DNA replication and repair protein RecF [Anaeroplasmataceae bacterium]